MLGNIYVRLVGGLGNQLFIYAFGLAKAERSGKDLVIDNISGFSSRDIYQAIYCLNSFPINESLLSDSKLKHLIANRYFWFLARKLRICYSERDPYSYHEDAVKSHSLFFQGYWQSYLYFNEYKDIIKERLRFNDTNNPKIIDYKNAILNSKNSVAIGMRFYDKFPEDSAIYQSQSEHFYSKAIDLLESTENDLTYFVFSLNIEKAKQVLSNFQDRNIVFLEPLPGLDNAAFDLYLMTLCNHFIISNSTMYWWAAYLGEDENSTVIAPKMGLSNQDALLPYWIKVE